MTALDSILDRLPAEHREAFLRLIHAHNIAEDSSDLIQAAIATEALAAVLQAVVGERERIEGAASDLPEAMRAAAVPIVASLADSTKDAVVVGVRTDLRDDFKTVFTGVANLATAVVEEAAEKIEQISLATADLARQAEADSQETAASYQRAALKIVEASGRITGWTAFRISSTGVGAAAVLLAFILGWTSQFAHTSASEVLGCNRNVAHAAGHLGLSGHATNYLRSAICQGGS